jgi:uncharacterized membrane protein
MSDYTKPIRLNCPVCETGLRIGAAVDRLVCLNCGAELNVARDGDDARLVPSDATLAELSPTEQELIEVNTKIRDSDQVIGVGCAVATMSLTLLSCIGISIAAILGNQVLFWIALFGGLIALMIVLFLFAAASQRRMTPLLNRRDRLQTELEPEE